MFRAHFGGGPGGGFRRHAGPAPAQQQPANPAAQLLHILPVLFLLLFTFMQMPSQPVRCSPCSPAIAEHCRCDCGFLQTEKWFFSLADHTAPALL